MSDFQRSRPRKRKRRLRPWAKAALLGIVLAAVICVAATIGTLLSHRQKAPEETQPPKDSEQVTQPSAQTAPTETAAPTEEPPTLPPETTQPATEDDIQKSAAYQKIMSLYNAELFDPAALEDFAREIESRDGFMEQYPEGWRLTTTWKGFKLSGYTPIVDAVDLVCRRGYFSLEWENGSISYYFQRDPYDDPMFPRYFTPIPREDIAAKVYGAEDPIGVDEPLKEAFVDAIQFSDWFAWSVLYPDYRTEWRFFEAPLPHDSNQTPYLQLEVKVWRPDAEEDDYVICSYFFNGIQVMDGARDQLPE